VGQEAEAAQQKGQIEVDDVLNTINGKSTLLIGS